MLSYSQDSAVPPVRLHALCKPSELIWILCRAAVKSIIFIYFQKELSEGEERVSGMHKLGQETLVVFSLGKSCSLPGTSGIVASSKKPSLASSDIYMSMVLVLYVVCCCSTHNYHSH